MTLREAIIKYRKDHDLSQRQFALKAGLSNGYISMLENNMNPKTGQPLTPTMPAIKKLANAMDVSIDVLFATVDDMPISLDRTDYTELLASTTEEIGSGRTAAADEMRRLFGTDHFTLSTYACEDKNKLSVLYYNALERNKALSLSAIISKVEELPSKQVKQIERLTYSYLKAKQPIRNIVDTALEPYMEDVDELGCNDSQLAVSVSKSNIKPDRTDQVVHYYPKVKVKHRKDDFSELTVFEEAAAAGLGNYLSDTPVTHIEQYPSGMIPAGTNYGVPISGDSMTPKFKDGSTAFVQSTPVINDGEIGVFALNGSSYIKQLIVDRENGTVHLHSLNPNYKDIIVSESDTLYTFGRVLGSYPE